MTSRKDFNETWLAEYPLGLPPADHYSSVVYNIKDRINSGADIVDIGHGYKKIVGEQVCYYWHEDHSDITIAVELSVKPQALVVNSIGKKSKTPPYASDLYDTVLKDSHRAIRLMSDDKLTDEGFNIWKRLLTLGHSVTVYDKKLPGQSMISIKTINDLKNYFDHHNIDFTRYQYVLSEMSYLGETRSFFNTRRLRELCGSL